MCVASFWVTFRSSPVVDMSVHGDHGSRAAKRRRGRRLRMHWRHEQLTLQMALAAALHHSRDVGPVTYNAPRSQRTANAGEWGREMNIPATIRNPPLPSWSSSASAKKSRAGRGLTGSSRSGLRSGISGAPWYRSSTTRWSCRRLTFLCRRWRSSWWRCAGSSIFAFPSRLSKYPRSHLHPVFLAGVGCSDCRRRRNSWWKCLRSFLCLLCVRL